MKKRTEHRFLKGIIIFLATLLVAQCACFYLVMEQDREVEIELYGYDF